LCCVLAALFAACGARAKPAAPGTPAQPFVTIADGKIHDGTTPPPDKGLYVKGRLEGGRFIPESNDIDGTGEVGPVSDGQPGWMELADGSFTPAQTARAPRRPYVEGYRLKDGTFQPTSRTIVF
jgi:hypothetical protein